MLSLSNKMKYHVVHHFDAERHMEIINLRKNGKTLQYIGNLFGVSRERIRQILDRHKISGRLPTEIKIKPIKKTFEQRFIEKIDIKDIDECWEWLGAKFPSGYGHLYYRGKYAYAHRVSYEIFVESYDPSWYVLHKCDNPSCVNPNHLYLGTQADNIRDRDARGRSRYRKSIYSNEELILIMKNYSEWDGMLKDFWIEYNIRPTIWYSLKKKYKRLENSNVI